MRIALIAIAPLALALGACGWEVTTLADLLGRDDEMSARPPRPAPQSSVALGEAASRAALAASPEVTAELLRRGARQYAVYCTPCHGADGAGHGSAVRQGYPRPPPLGAASPRVKRPEDVVRIVGEGVGIMYGFGERIPPSDRWAVAHYVRTLRHEPPERRR